MKKKDKQPQQGGVGKILSNVLMINYNNINQLWINNCINELYEFKNV